MEEMILQDIANIYDCPHTTAKDEGVGVPLIRTPNVGKGRLDLTNVHRVSCEIYNERTLRAIPIIESPISHTCHTFRNNNFRHKAA